MKFITSVLFLIFLKTLVFGQEQDNSRSTSDYKTLLKETPVKLTVTTNPLCVFNGPFFATSEYRINLEMMHSRKQSAYLGLSYVSKNIFLFSLIKLFSNNLNTPKTYINGYRIGAGYKFYVNKTEYRPEGFFFSPYVMYAFAKYDFGNLTKYYITTQKFSINALFGFQKIIKDKFVIEIFNGPGFFHTKWTEHNVKNNIHYLEEMPNIPLQFTFGIQIGLAI